MSRAAFTFRGVFVSRITLDEFHLTVRVPAGLSDAVTTDMVRTLSRRSLQRRLAKLVKRFLHRYPDLAPVTVRISR
jgi:hypothetical protein